MNAESLGKRVFARIRMRTEAQVRACGDGALLIRCRVRDLSPAGLFVTALDELQVGVVCEVRIDNPMGGVVSAIGRVVRSERGGMAILFTQINEPNRAQLDRMLAGYPADLTREQNPPAVPQKSQQKIW